MHRDSNPTDALTNVDGAHVVPMAHVLRTATLSIVEEAEELEARRAINDWLGYVPRPRKSA